jgi:hypothetical protein
MSAAGCRNSKDLAAILATSRAREPERATRIFRARGLSGKRGKLLRFPARIYRSMRKPRYVIISVRSIDPRRNYESLAFAPPPGVGDEVVQLLRSRKWKRLPPCPHYQGSPGHCLANAQTCVRQFGGAMPIVMMRYNDGGESRHLSCWHLYLHAAWTDGKTISDPTRQFCRVEYLPATHVPSDLSNHNASGRTEVVPYAFSFAYTLQGVETALSPQHCVRRAWVYDTRERTLMDHGLCFPPLFKAA